MRTVFMARVSIAPPRSRISASNRLTATESGRSRLTLGAWSWAGVAGILITFDADLSDVRPPELVEACRRLARRLTRLG
jgi:hypothetical protein